MKKSNQTVDSSIHKDGLSKYSSSGQIKTTNVNILLNRVKLDKQKTIKKRIIFSLTLISLISALAIYLAI